MLAAQVRSGPAASAMARDTCSSRRLRSTYTARRRSVRLRSTWARRAVSAARGISMPANGSAPYSTRRRRSTSANFWAKAWVASSTSSREEEHGGQPHRGLSDAEAIAAAVDLRPVEGGQGRGSRSRPRSAGGPPRRRCRTALPRRDRRPAPRGTARRSRRAPGRPPAAGPASGLRTSSGIASLPPGAGAAGRRELSEVAFARATRARRLRRPRGARSDKRASEERASRIPSLDGDHGGPGRAARGPFDVARPSAASGHRAALGEGGAVQVEHLVMWEEANERRQHGTDAALRHRVAGDTN